MKLERLRTRADDECLSDLQLDALELGALDAGRSAQAEAHLARCERCAERRRALAEATRVSARRIAASPLQALTRARPDAAAGGVGPRRAAGRRWLAGAGAALAAAAALLLVVGREPLDPGGVRGKGASHVGFFVKHGAAVRRGAVRERVSPGDALRFVVTSTAPRYVAVLSRDGAGQVSVYHPRGPRAERVEPGVERALDASVVLDDVLGEERLYALTCSAAIELAPLGAALRRAGAEPAWPAECSVDRFVLIKAPAGEAAP